MPKVYLKNFCAKDDSIAVLDKTRNRIFSTGLEAVAVEKNFYTVDGLEDPYCWEKAYAKSIEPMMSMLLPKIISRVHVLVQTGHCIISKDEKSQLALTMVMQLLRGKQSRAYEKKLFDELLPSTIEKAKEKFGPLTDDQQKRLDTFGTDPQFFKQISMELTWDIERLTLYTNVLGWHDFVFYHMLSVGRNIEKLMLCGGVIHMETEQSESDQARINCLPTPKAFSKKMKILLFISKK